MHVKVGTCRVPAVLLVAGLLMGAGCASADKPPVGRAASQEEDPQIGEVFLADARELASDTGISLDEAIAALERQPLVGRLGSTMAERGPASFGGLFIDYTPDYRITMLALPGGADEVEGAVDERGFAELSPFVSVRETPYTEDVLKDAMRMVSDLCGTKLTWLDLDIRTGEILATAASPADVESIRSAVGAADPPVPARRVVVTEGGFADDVVSARFSVVSLHPDRVRPGDRAVLRVGRFPGGWGVGWDLELREGSSWDWVGLLKAGPGKAWRAEFFIGRGRVDVEDIGFGGPARLPLRIPNLAPGRYRLGQEFIRRGRGPLEDRLEWHYAEFEVLGS